MTRSNTQHLREEALSQDFSGKYNSRYDNVNVEEGTIFKKETVHYPNKKRGELERSKINRTVDCSGLTDKEFKAAQYFVEAATKGTIPRVLLDASDWSMLHKLGEDETLLIETFRKLNPENKKFVNLFSRVVQDKRLPDTAPELYPDRENKSEDIVAFLRRVYFQDGVEELPRSYLRRKDPRGYQALANWLRANELPSDISIPRNSSRFDDQISAFSDESIDVATFGKRLYNLAQGILSRSPR
ncbi:hypothetical protein [Ponticaulis profundi]|uniref:EcoEI R protein C-terminal domain-containing protein n=1 Tax=Ponticaulis profundi TaxID=2665222 RepID=A0ABW1SCD0_9PROT